MNVRKQHIPNAMTMVRLAAIVIVFVLGHDVMMTMLPHHTAAESAHHHVIEVEECGSSEGLAHPHTGPLVDQSIVHFTPVGLDNYLDTGASRAPEPAYIESDASVRRARLQVFLN